MSALVYLSTCDEHLPFWLIYASIFKDDLQHGLSCESCAVLKKVKDSEFCSYGNTL